MRWCCCERRGEGEQAGGRGVFWGRYSPLLLPSCDMRLTGRSEEVSKWYMESKKREQRPWKAAGEEIMREIGAGTTRGALKLESYPRMRGWMLGA